MSPLRAFSHRSYRIFYAAATLSNVGTWMQRIAQDWLVLTRLTHHDVSAVGVVTALQFIPQILLATLGGRAADGRDRRRLLLATQMGYALLASGLGMLVLAGSATLWEVYAFAVGTGLVAAFDTPTLSAFVSDLVPEEDLTNAIALNSVSWAASRMVGPAIAGLSIETFGLGPSFLANAASNLAVFAALSTLPSTKPHHEGDVDASLGSLADGFRHVMERPGLRAIFTMMILLSTVGFNLTVLVAAMAVRAFHRGAADFGLLSSCLAVGSLSGAAMAARRIEPRMRHLVLSAAAFGTALLAAAAATSYLAFGAVLVAVGFSMQTYSTTTNSLVQMSTMRGMRGRMMSLVMLSLGGISLLAPLLGIAADTLGPRGALIIGAVGAYAAALVGRREMRRERKGGLPGLD